MKLPIYMDYQATTPVDERVLVAMLPYFHHEFGNAHSGAHVYGHRAHEAVENARKSIADSIGAEPDEVIFTSGATESDNMALLGAALADGNRRRHIVTVQTEHKAILDTAAYLQRRGFKVTYLPVRPDGLLDLDQLADAITDDTLLVSVMAVNNEIGVIQPLAEIGKLCRRRGVLFHTDAAQGLTKIPIDVDELCIDLMSISGHKIYGPKGIGALFVRRREPAVTLAPIIHGGGQQWGLRSGTLDVPGIVGLAKAVELGVAEMENEQARIRRLRERLRKKLLRGLDDIYVNGSLEHRVAGNLNVSFAYVEGEATVLGLQETVAVSTGAACSSEGITPSHVIKALGVGDELIYSVVRFSIGRYNTEDEIDLVAEKVIEVVKRLRDMSPLYEQAVKSGRRGAHAADRPAGRRASKEV